MISLRLIAYDSPTRKSLFLNSSRRSSSPIVWLNWMIIVLLSRLGTSKIRYLPLAAFCAISGLFSGVLKLRVCIVISPFMIFSSSTSTSPRTSALNRSM